MTEKSYDAEDPRDLPYRFTYSPITDEVFVTAFTPHGWGVSDIFQNHFAFHRYLVEGLKLDDFIADKVLQQVTEILREKQDEGSNC